MKQHAREHCCMMVLCLPGLQACVYPARLDSALCLFLSLCLSYFCFGDFLYKACCVCAKQVADVGACCNHKMIVVNICLCQACTGLNKLKRCDKRGGGALMYVVMAVMPILHARLT